VVFQASGSAWVLIGHREVEAAWAVSGWLVAVQFAHLYLVWEHDLLQRSGQRGHWWFSVEWFCAQNPHTGPHSVLHAAWWYPSFWHLWHWYTTLPRNTATVTPPLRLQQPAPKPSIIPSDSDSQHSFTYLCECPASSTLISLTFVAKSEFSRVLGYPTMRNATKTSPTPRPTAQTVWERVPSPCGPS
jgi:hypothetical protein